MKIKVTKVSTPDSPYTFDTTIEIGPYDDKDDILSKLSEFLSLCGINSTNNEVTFDN